jgi:hypothetical protein
VSRFFFHQVHPDCRIEDYEGAAFEDLSSVRDEAIGAARELMSGAILQGKELKSSKFEIADQHGRTVLILPFVEAIGRRS